MKLSKSSQETGRRKMRTALPRDKSPGLTDQDSAKSLSVSDEGDGQNTMTESAICPLAQAYLEHLLKEKRDQPQVRQFGVKFMKFLQVAVLTAETSSEEKEAMARDVAILLQEALQSLPEQECEELVAKAWATVARRVYAAYSGADKGCPPE